MDKLTRNDLVDILGTTILLLSVAAITAICLTVSREHYRQFCCADKPITVAYANDIVSTTRSVEGALMHNTRRRSEIVWRAFRGGYRNVLIRSDARNAIPARICRVTIVDRTAPSAEIVVENI